jgi:hypothetical protein
MQYYIGRNLSFTGKAEDGQKLLRALTAGDARLVHIPAQRSAALMLSKIALDRGNISQAAIWMRRAVIGALVDKGASSVEIVDILTEYANYLSQTRQLAEALNLFSKLAPLYDTQFAHRGPKFLHFLSVFLETLTSVGNFQAADVVLKMLNETVATVDIVATSVRQELFFQNLYKNVRTPSADGHAPNTESLKQTILTYPDFVKTPRNRIILTYFALLADDLALAEQLNSTHQADESTDAQFASYDVVLRSFIAARQNKFDESIALSQDAVDKIHLFHQRSRKRIV